MWFLDSPPKKVQMCKFSWILALQNSNYNNFIRYRKFKMTDFWKKALKLPPNFQNRYLRNHLEFAHFWKICSLLFLISRNMWARLDQNLRGWVTKLKILSLFDILPRYLVDYKLIFWRFVNLLPKAKRPL